jgi:hypothetical protein
MEPKQAVMTLLAAAGMFTAADGQTEGTAESSAAEPAGLDSADPAAGLPGTSSQSSTELTDKLPSPPDTAPAVMRYGIIPRPDKSAGAAARTSAARQATRVAQALRVLSTPEGSKAGAKAGVTPAKIAEQRNRLRAFDAAAARLGCSVALPIGIRAAPIVAMKYGILPIQSCSPSAALAAARKQARRVSDALRVLSTPAGLQEAQRVGLTAKKIAVVQAKLVAFDTKVMALRCP